MLEGVRTLRTLTMLLAFAALTVTGVGCQLFHEHDAAALRAGHWRQEPDGFGGLKFDATTAETEKKITGKLQDPGGACGRQEGGGREDELAARMQGVTESGREVLHRQCPVRRSARW